MGRLAGPLACWQSPQLRQQLSALRGSGDGDASPPVAASGSAPCSCPESMPASTHLAVPTRFDSDFSGLVSADEFTVVEPAGAGLGGGFVDALNDVPVVGVVRAVDGLRALWVGSQHQGGHVGYLESTVADRYSVCSRVLTRSPGRNVTALEVTLRCRPSARLLIVFMCGVSAFVCRNRSTRRG